jgi:hypothetical protein
MDRSFVYSTGDDAMGIDLNCAQLLIRAKANGVSFERLATLGRQELHANRHELLSVLSRNNYKLSLELQRKLLDPTTVYAEDFFTLLGTKEIFAIDASDYEGSQLVHDMNNPIPEDLKSSFNVVLDGGTLEHVFNFPVAAGNCMSLVRIGGRFISLTMANNFCGHGFYQFSPELFFRLLSKENGYAMEVCIEWEAVHGSNFFDVPDPASIGNRIELTSRSGTYMFVQALRLAELQSQYVPRQSDYCAQWSLTKSKMPSLGDAPMTHSRSRFRAYLKKIRFLRSAVLNSREWAREIAILRRWMIRAEYRSQALHRNTYGYLQPLADIRVRL